MKIFIIGAGLAGLTAAAFLSKDINNKIEIFEIRNHIGGNCYDYLSDGILIHKYGPHIFHTNDEDIWNFIKQYTEFTDYKHVVYADTTIGRFIIPYNKISEKTLNRTLTHDEIVKYIFKDYSEKMWNVSWNDLPYEIINRVPEIRNNENINYFTDKFQGMPMLGYTAIFNNMINSSNIKVHLNCLNNDWKKYNADMIIYTGRIDEFFNYCHGKLEYRSLDIYHYKSNDLIPSSVLNNCTANAKYTRITNYNMFYNYNNGAYSSNYSIEFPINCGDVSIPYYPVNFGTNLNIVNKYKNMHVNKNTILCGRLGRNMYMNMDATIQNTLNLLKYEEI